MKRHEITYDEVKDFVTRRVIAASTDSKSSKRLEVVTWEEGHDYEVYSDGVLMWETMSLADAVNLYNSLD